MLAAGPSSRAVFLVLALCLTGSSLTYPQNSASINGSRMSGNRSSSGAWLAKCGTSSAYLAAAWRFIDGLESPPVIHGITSHSNDPGPSEGLCLGPDSSAPARPLAGNPCPQNVSAMRYLPRTYPCQDIQDFIPAELSALGKAGLKIARAREVVLDILRSQNACTEWLETKAAVPAATF